MIAISRLAKAAVLACMAAAICSMAPPAATAVAVQAKVTSAVAQVPAAPTPSAGVLTGTVRALGGPGLAGICVTATAPTGGTEVVSQAGGRYVISGLRPETYRVDFRDCGQPGRYAEQWYGGALTAGAGQSVLVAPGHPTFLSPVTLRPVSGTAFVAASARAIRSKLRAEGRPSSGQAPQLSGTVTSAAGQRLAGICVTAVQVHSGDQSLEFGIGTGKNGTYQFPAGSFDNGTSWKVSFSIGCGSQGDFAPQWWKDVPLQSDGTVLRFGKNNRFANIDARLGKGASISGVVRAGSKSGPVLPGACVVANPLGGTMPEGLEVATGPNGKYLIPGLGTGRYSVVFAPGCGNKGSFSLGKSTSVSVTDGKTTRGVDGFLPKAGEFSGTVTAGPQRRPVPGICVEAQGIIGHQEVGVDGRTSSTGHYAFADLPAGHYQVAFFAGCGSKGSFAPQFYKGQENAAAADSFLVRPGARVGGINAVMRPGGIVTGMVTDTAGRKLTGVCVVLANQAVPGPIISISIGVSVGGGAAPASASSSPVSGSLPFLAFGVTTDGHYRITDLQPGNYSVTYSTGCKRHQPTESTAWFSPEGNDARSLLTVGTATTTGVDAKLSAPGTITGMITGPAGQPVAGVCAVSVGLSGEPDKSLASLENFADTPKSNREGRYQITGLAAGRYGIQFFPCTNSKPVAIEWYRHSAGFAGLTPVVVRSGQVTAGIDGHLVTGQSISGRITVAGSRGPVFQRACIRVTDPSGNFVAGFGESKKDGTYLVPNLAPGTYNLQVGPCGGDALSTVLRTHVKVGASSPTTRVDVALPAPGLIAGRVTGGSRARAVGGSCVIATPEMGHGTAQTAFSASDGTYSLGGLAPGKYRIEFTTDCEESSGGFASQWFDHKATSAKSTPVVVRSGKVTAGIDARLAADGTISGLVKVSGKPGAGVCVLAFRKAGGTMPTIGVTDARGSYLIGGLRPGRYVVEFTGGCGVRSYRTQWFDGASSRKGATPVAVRAGSKATGINAH